MTGLRRFLIAGGACPAGSELTRAASEGPGPQLQAHLERCADCAAEYESLRQLSSELSALPQPPLRAETFDLIATNLLGARMPATLSTSRPARSGRRLERLTWSMALCAVLVGGGVWLSRRSSPSAPALPVAQNPIANHAAIRAFGDARFERVQGAPEERVRLDEGTLQLDVPALGPTESFRVLTMDAGFRTRATQFEMTATGGRLERVRVWSGRVEIHSSRFAVTVLETGDQWNRERPGDVPATATPPSPARRTRAVPARAVAVLAARPAPAEPAAVPRTPEQLRFDRAWALLREGHAAESATAFSDVARRAHGTALEEDAVYWHAVALARAGDGAGAERELRAFLDRFPRSSHGGEATVALGWMLFESGQTASARTFFERAAHDPSARVKQSALEGLERSAH